MKTAFLHKDPERNLYYYNMDDSCMYGIKDETYITMIMWYTLEFMVLRLVLPKLLAMTGLINDRTLTKGTADLFQLFPWAGLTLTLLAVLIVVGKHRSISARLTEENKGEIRTKDLQRIYAHGAFYRHIVKVFLQLALVFYAACIVIAANDKEYAIVAILFPLLLMRVLDYIVTVKPFCRKGFEKHLHALSSKTSRSDPPGQ